MSLIHAMCEGGPHHGKILAHARPAFRVTVTRGRPKLTVPGYVGPPNEDVSVGCYVFHTSSELWHWFHDIQDAPVSPQQYALWITEPPVTSQIAPGVAQR